MTCVMMITSINSQIKWKDYRTFDENDDDDEDDDEPVPKR